MATAYEVELLFRGGNTSALDKLERRLGDLERKLAGGVGGRDPFQPLASSAVRAERGMGVLTGAVGQLQVALAALGIGAVVRDLVGGAAALIRMAGESQKLNASFVGLTGSSKAAATLRNELFQLSKTTPFKNDELLETARRFLAVGVAGDKLSGTINQIGNIAAQSGQNLDRIGLIYAQVFAKGRLTGEENLQFLEAGIDLQDELARVTGRSGKALQDAMSKGQISIQDVNNAIKLANGNLSALEAAGKAVDVQLNNIGDNAEQVGVAAAGALAPAFAAVFGTINQGFDSLFPNLQAIDARFAPILQKTQRFAELLEKNPQIVAAIATALDSLLNFAIRPIDKGLDNINKQLEKNPTGLVDAILDLELGLRKSVLSLAGIVSLLEAARRAASGGLLFDREGLGRSLGAGIDFIQQAGAQQRAQLRNLSAGPPPPLPRRTEMDNKLGAGAGTGAGAGAGASRGGALDELLRRIRSGEGGYESINRGGAGDTPGGYPGLTSLSVGQVMGLQRSGRAFAVGAYQFIPETLAGAVQRSGVSTKERFSPQTQDLLATELILGGTKRPALAAYLKGEIDNLGAALKDAALEWASLTGPGGRGAYDGVAGNRGSISVRDLLPQVRQEIMGGGGGYDRLAQGRYEAAERANRLQRDLNSAGTEALTLERDRALIGKSRLDQLVIEDQYAQRILASKLQQLELDRDLDPALRQAQRDNLIRDFEADAAKRQETYKELLRDITELGTSTGELENKLLGISGTPLDPLQAEVGKVRDVLLELDRAAEASLSKLSALGGTNPETGDARARLGNLRGRIAGIDPAALAAQNLAYPLRQGLEGDIARTRAERRGPPSQAALLQLDKTYQALPAAQQQVLDGLAKQLDAEKLANAEYERTKSLVQDIGSALSTGLSSAIDGLIRGTTTLKEAFADILGNIGKILIQNSISGLLGTINIGGTPLMPKFAEGGYVAGPTLAEVGEGGESEYIIPSSKMGSAMARYSAGARGDAVLQPGGDGEGFGPMAEGGVPAVSVTFAGDIMRFQDTDYVRQDQIPAVVREAALQGAKIGEQRTIRRMQQSPGTRRRLGL